MCFQIGCIVADSMEYGSSTPEDHQSSHILVKLCAHSDNNDAINLDFTKLVTRLRRIQNVPLQDHTYRWIRPKFVTSVDGDMVDWGEMQAHRRVLGLICVSFANSGPGRVLRSSVSTDSTSNTPDTDTPPTDASTQMESIMSQFETMKKTWASKVVDSRYFIFGSDSMNELGELVENSVKGRLSERELIVYNGHGSATRFDSDVCDLLRAILTVLYSRSMDSSFEKMEIPNCPIVPAEGKDRVGLENKNSKPYKKKCLGRLRKQAADYTLLTGVAGAAVGMYETAIESLKACNDWLWLASAYEGWACAVVIGKYRLNMDQKASLQRVATFSSKTELETSNPSKGFVSEPPHKTVHRLRHILRKSLSFESHLRGGSGIPQVEDVSMLVQGYDWNSCRVDLLINKFKAALDNYEKFSFAVKIEFDCVFNAATVFRRENMLCEYECFLREHMNKYLDVQFTAFTNAYKSNICLMLSTIFREIGFNRKESFYLRLAALFKSSDQMNSADYASQIFPWLYRASLGYGVRENCRDLPLGVEKGWAYVQKWGLRELWTSSQRGQYSEATIRLMLYSLQGYMQHMNYEELHDLFVSICEHANATSESGVHIASNYIRLPNDIIIPPIQMFNVPVVTEFQVVSLPGDLAPSHVKRQQPAIFLYNPYEKVEKDVVRWVVNCPCAVSISIRNSLPFELELTNLQLQIENNKRGEETFESNPVKVTLAPAPSDAVRIQLAVEPKTTGILQIAGYTYECMSVRNLVRLKDIPWMKESFNCQSQCIQVEVLPSLPYLQLDSSLPRSEVMLADDDNQVLIVETTVFSGQIFEHTIDVTNISRTDAVNSISITISQPAVCGGPSLITKLGSPNADESESDPWRFATKTLPPTESRKLRMQIFGVDPNTVLDTDNSTQQTNTVSGERIPYSGRLVKGQIVLTYQGGTPSGDVYSRTSVFTMYITVIPAVTVAHWQLLSGDSINNRYLILDVHNSTKYEADLHFGDDKTISVESNEECRVPVLCPCCECVGCLPELSERPLVVQMEEWQRVRRLLHDHVEKHVTVTYNIPWESASGVVPVGSLLASDSLIRQLVLPVLSIGLSVNGVACHGKEEMTVGVGEMTGLLLKMTTTAQVGSVSGVVSVTCTQDVGGNVQAVDRSDHVVSVGAVVQPFSLYSSPSEENDIDAIDIEFALIFCYEGVYKVRPQYVFDDHCSHINRTDLFLPTVTFVVVSKAP